MSEKWVKKRVAKILVLSNVSTEWVNLNLLLLSETIKNSETMKSNYQVL